MSAQLSPAWRFALAAAARGWPVFPLNGKVPFAKSHGFLDASTDPEVIARWPAKYPRANAAVRTGPESGLLALDVDGAAGEERLAALTTEHGPLPRTFTVKTARGRHHYFRFPPGAEITIGAGLGGRPGLDWRGRNGYVLLPGSVHPSGHVYRVETAAPIAPCPDWLRRLLESPERPTSPPVDLRPLPPGAGSSRYGRRVLAMEARNVAEAAEGRRNSALYDAARRVAQLVAGGEIDPAEAEEDLRTAARVAGLDDREFRSTWHSALRAGMARPRSAARRTCQGGGQ